MAKKITPLIGIINMEVTEEDGRITAAGRCVVKLTGSRGKIDTDDIRINIPLRENAAEISFGSKYGTTLPGGYQLNTFRLSVDISDAKTFDIQNKLMPVYRDSEEGRILYNFFDLKKGRNRNSRIILSGDKAIYFRQNMYNTLNLTVREANQYDTEEGQRRLAEAQKRAEKLKGSDIILMYEKNCSRYEESASVLYERLIDAGYDNVFFIVDTDIPAVKALPEKYKKNLIAKDSDKHLEYFFACDKFISSETIDHALQLRVASKAVQDKITGKGLSYVFLQHGVMYMVSLDSKLRVGFKKKKGYKLHKTVVSSEAEARHFIDLAGMDRDDLYITGLAKFDTSYRNEDADRIIIMPTWRRWETNQANEDVEDTGYYRMLERMYDSVPDELKDKVIILPHPLIAEQFRGEQGLGHHFLMADSYDKVFRDCDLLITDYSSIAYDAFYRGANVVFDWEDLDECMEHYGEGSHLMLNDGNAFGRVCRSRDELKRAVAESYGQPQREEDIERYRKIVEFHDGKNSDRIIEKLKKDGMLGL